MSKVNFQMSISHMCFRVDKKIWNLPSEPLIASKAVLCVFWLFTIIKNERGEHGGLV